MKLIIAITQDESASRLVGELVKNGLSATKLATTGGFLKSGNTTLLIGVEEERFQEAMTILENVCKSRKKVAPVMPGPSMNGTGTVYPMEVLVGGATVFVLEVEQFLKL